jgi:hypothetical protein
MVIELCGENSLVNDTGVGRHAKSGPHPEKTEALHTKK